MGPEFLSALFFKTPCVAAHVVDSELRLPAEEFLCERRIALVGGDVACAAGTDFEGNPAA